MWYVLPFVMEKWCMNMWSKIYKVIFMVCFLFIIVALVYFAFFAEEQRAKGISKCVVLLITYISAMIRGNKKRTPKISYGTYEREYQDIIDGTFENDKSSYKKLLKAIACYNTDKFKEAHRLLKSLLKKCMSIRDFVAVYMFQALCYTDEGKTKEAIEVYQKILQYDLANSRTWSNMGMRYLELGKTLEAEDAYKNAVRYNPENAYAYTNLAAYYIRQEEAEQALLNALKALELNSHIYQAMSAAAIAYKMLGDDANAEKYCQLYGMNGGNAEDLKRSLAEI